MTQLGSDVHRQRWLTPNRAVYRRRPTMFRGSAADARSQARSKTTKSWKKRPGFFLPASGGEIVRDLQTGIGYCLIERRLSDADSVLGNLRPFGWK